jgi:CBS domain-containing protein
MVAHALQGGMHAAIMDGDHAGPAHEPHIRHGGEFLDGPRGPAMTGHAVMCFADQDIEEAAQIMGEAQVRHLLVMDRSGGFVGMLSLDDIAENASEELAGQALGEIVEKRA